MQEEIIAMGKEERLYKEDLNAGKAYRVEQLRQIELLIKEKRLEADNTRTKYFMPDYTSIETYTDSTAEHRQRFINMLGWPLNTYSPDMESPEAKVEFVAEDSLGTIYRLTIGVMPGLDSYGILFLPHGEGPFPLVISQHGGSGTPELCSGFTDSANYNDMTRRVLRKGIAVFAPQLLLWNPDWGPIQDRVEIDSQLKQLGGSITALEIFKLSRSLDYLLARSDIEESRVGMIGLSYGGFYTLFTTACDLRIKAVLSSCFFNNRFEYGWKDWIWFNSGNTYLDAEICALICPRPLFIEVGNADELFDVKYAGAEYSKVQAVYDKLALSNNLVYKEFDGGHELDKADEGIDFLCAKVMAD